VPYLGGDDDLVFLAERRQSAPHSRLGQIANLRFQKFWQTFVLNDRPGGKPRKQTRGQHIQPDQGVVERQPYRNQENDVRHRNPGKYGDQVDRQRRWKPDIIQLI
jgi:hypothetical protein